MVPARDVIRHPQAIEDALVARQPGIAIADRRRQRLARRLAMLVVALQGVGHHHLHMAEAGLVDQVDGRAQLLVLVILLANADRQHHALAVELMLFAALVEIRLEVDFLHSAHGISSSRPKAGFRRSNR